MTTVRFRPDLSREAHPEEKEPVLTKVAMLLRDEVNGALTFSLVEGSYSPYHGKGVWHFAKRTLLDGCIIP